MKYFTVIVWLCLCGCSSGFSSLESSPAAPNLTLGGPEQYSYGTSGITLTGECESGISVMVSGDIDGLANFPCNEKIYSAAITFSAGSGEKNLTISQTGTGGLKTEVSGTFIRAPRVFYISPQGNDSANGLTPSTAFKTISHLNTLTFVPGDYIAFKGGSTFNGNLYLTNSGTALNPIQITSYGTGRATINAGTSFGIYVYNASGISIHDIDVYSPNAAANSKSGIEFYNDLTGNVKLPYVHIKNVNARGFGKSGIQIGSWPSDNSKSGFEDVTISNVISYENRHSGIIVFGYGDPSAATYAHRNVYISRSVTHGNTGIPGASEPTGNGIVISDVDTGTIEYCASYNNGAISNLPSAGPVGIWAWASTGVKIQYNESHHNLTTTIDGGGFDLDGGMKNSVMQYNYSHRNKGAGYLVYQFSTGAGYSMSNLAVRYNISENDGLGTDYGAVFVGAASGTTITGPVYVYNNTFYANAAVTGTATRMLYTNTPNTHFRNNIFMTTGGLKIVDIESDPTQVLQKNNYYATDGVYNFRWNGNNYSSIATWRVASSLETSSGMNTSLSANPLLTTPGTGITLNSLSGPNSLTAYRLQAGSPMIDVGDNLSSIVGAVGLRDFYGNTIPVRTNYDVGAHEAP